MNNAHEQTWTKDEHRPGVIRATDAISLEVKVAFWRIPGGDAEALRQAREIEALALAAPDMARALMTLLKNDDAGHVNRVEDIEAARTALRKAKVLP